MQIPNLAEIQSAELKFVQSRRDVHIRFLRARTALRNTAARPVTLAAIAAAAGLVGYWLTRRKSVRPEKDSAAATTGVFASAVSLAMTFLVRYAIQHLPFIVQQVRAMKQSRPSPTV